MRKALDYTQSVAAFADDMAESNAEARRIIERIFQKFQGNAVNILLLFESMNVRGCQICFAVNAICKGNLDMLFQKLTTDPSLFSEINRIASLANFTEERARFAANEFIVIEHCTTKG